MPVYQYKCRNCGEISEFMLPMQQNNEIIACRSCGERDMQRMITAPNLVKARANAPGSTCCGRNERCDTPPCSTGDGCRRA